MNESHSTRRECLKLAGGAISLSLAGCTSSGDNEPSTKTQEETTAEAAEPTTKTQEETTTEPPQDEFVQQFSFDAPNTFEVTPAVSGTTVFAPNTDRNLYAVDIETGESLWSYEFNVAVDATPAAGDAGVFTNKESENEMYRFDPSSGDVDWSINPDHSFYPNSPAYNGEYVFVSDDGVKAFNKNNGEEEWNYRFEGTLYTSSTVQLTDTNVVNISEYGVFAVSQDDGTEQWTFEGAGEARPDSLATNSDRVIYADGSNSIYIMDSQSGDTVHQISTADAVSETTLTDNVLYYDDGGLTAFDLNSMSELWSSDVSIDRLTDDTLNGYLFGLDFEEIVGVDISNGDRVISQPLNAPYNIEPVIAEDHVVMANDSNSLLGYQIVSN